MMSSRTRLSISETAQSFIGDYLNDPEFSIVSPYRNLNYFSFNQERP